MNNGQLPIPNTSNNEPQLKRQKISHQPYPLTYQQPLMPPPPTSNRSMTVEEALLLKIESMENQSNITQQHIDQMGKSLDKTSTDTMPILQQMTAIKQQNNMLQQQINILFQNNELLKKENQRLNKENQLLKKRLSKVDEDEDDDLGIKSHNFNANRHPSTSHQPNNISNAFRESPLSSNGTENEQPYSSNLNANNATLFHHKKGVHDQDTSASDKNRSQYNQPYPTYTTTHTTHPPASFNNISNRQF